MLLNERDRERERERKKERKKERKSERERHNSGFVFYPLKTLMSHVDLVFPFFALMCS